MPQLTEVLNTEIALHKTVVIVWKTNSKPFFKVLITSWKILMQKFVREIMISLQSQKSN